ncbi:hypothetical protein CR513_37636, partial [Mucuna pruriens]
MEVVVDDLEQKHEELMGDNREKALEAVLQKLCKLPLTTPRGSLRTSHIIKSHFLLMTYLLTIHPLWPQRRINIPLLRTNNVKGLSFLCRSETWLRTQILTYGFQAVDLCLVPDMVIPHNFKVPDFDKYKGNSCQKNHLISYCRKMDAHTHNDKLLIYFFQESLTKAALGWYLNLENGRIQTWKDLVEAFLKQYKYNKDMASNRTQL